MAVGEGRFGLAVGEGRDFAVGDAARRLRDGVGILDGEQRTRLARPGCDDVFVMCGLWPTRSARTNHTRAQEAVHSTVRTTVVPYVLYVRPSQV